MKQSFADRLRGGWEDKTGFSGRHLLLWSLGFTLFWGLLAHAYAFLQDSFSHDVLNALYADGVETYWKMQLGRFGTVIYRRLIRVPLTMPWLCGLLGLFWAGLAVFLTGKLFELRSKLGLFVLSGIFTVNLTVIAMTASYLYEMDMDMFALLLSAAAAFAWARFGWPGAVLGALLCTGVLSLYQSYISVVLALVMLLCIRRLLTGWRFRDAFFPGLRSILMLGAGGGLYYALLQMMVRVKDITLDTGSYNSVFTALEPGNNAPGLLERLHAVYREFGGTFFDPAVSHLSAGAWRLNALLLILAAVLLVWVLLKNRPGWAETLLALVLLALLPLGLNAARIFSGGAAHDLMKYGFWMIYLLPLLLALSLPGKKEMRLCSALAAALLLLLLWDNVQTANALYVKKDLEQDATLSLMTRAIGRIENEPGYVPGETTLVFVGAGGTLNPGVYGYEAYSDITGAESPSAIPFSDGTYYYNAYRAYFRYVLNTRVNLAEPAVWTKVQEDERVADMPVYPAEGCLRELDGIWVMKLGERVDWSEGE